MLFQRCQSSFDLNTRSEGFALCNKNRVELRRSGPTVITAKIKDQLREEVELDWSEAGDGVLQARCSCDDFFNGRLCRHVWATLLEIDGTGNAKVPGNSKLEVIPDEAFTLDLDEDFSEYDELVAMPRRKRVSAKSRGTWKTQLQGVRAWMAAYRHSSHATRRAVPEKERELWYVLNVASTAEKAKPEIEFHQREKKKDGEWGVMRKQSVSLEGSWLNALDQRLVMMLVGSQSVIQTSYASYGYSQFQSPSTFAGCAMSPALYDHVMPELCATGRVTWIRDSNHPVDPSRVLTWQGGEPWRFRLVGDADGRKSRYTIRGEFYRGEETAALTDPVICLADGVVLFHDRLARLDVSPDFAWVVALKANGEMVVPYKERAKFLQEWWSAPHQPEARFPDSLAAETVCLPPEPKLVIKAPVGYYDSNFLPADAIVRYGDWEIDIHDPCGAEFHESDNRVFVRDRAREQALIQQMLACDVRCADRRSNQARYRVRKRQLPAVVDRLLAANWQVVSEGILIRRPGAVRLSVKSDVDWFELDGQVDFEGVTASLPSLLAALRSGKKYVQLDDGTHGMLPEEWLKRYGGLADLGTAEGNQIRFGRTQALLLDALLAAQENVQFDRSFVDFRERLQAFSGISSSETTSGFSGELRPYQKEGLGWLHFLRDFQFGGCLADDMGLGKTVQVLALLAARRDQRREKGEPHQPSIAVVPKSLVFNWIEEGHRFAPQLRIANYTGLDRSTLLQNPQDCDLLVTTYGTLLRDITTLKDVRFDYAILDEATAIKNSNSQSAKACRLLSADHRLAMTGTPVENHLGELWSLFEFLNPGMLGRSTAFNSMTRGTQPDTLHMLAQALRPFLLRRTKEQVLTDLPEKTEQTLYCEMDTKQRALYNELKEYYRASLAQRVQDVGLKKSKIHVLEALLRLRQAACHPGLLDKKKSQEPSAKLEALFEQLDEIVDGGHKALVFSQFTSLLAIVRGQLDARKITYEYLDGSTRDRGHRVQRFQTDPECPLFLISLKAGGHGLNLTAADYVFILDPWWNPAVEAQAVDRAHRIGQTNRVFAYRLICRDTVEDKILELQKSKRDLADAIISEDNSLIRTLTAEDLQLLLS